MTFRNPTGRDVIIVVSVSVTASYGSCFTHGETHILLEEKFCFPDLISILEWVDSDAELLWCNCSWGSEQCSWGTVDLEQEDLAYRACPRAWTGHLPPWRQSAASLDQDFGSWSVLSHRWWMTVQVNVSNPTPLLWAVLYPPNSYVEALTPSVTIIGIWAYRAVLKVKGGHKRGTSSNITDVFLRRGR